MSAKRTTWRRRLGLLGVGAVLVLLTGCGYDYTVSPAMTVQAFFLYINRGAMESAWQELDLPLQEHARTTAVVAPDGLPGRSLGWPSQAAFARAVRVDLAPFLHGARMRQSVAAYAATVTARAPDGGATLFVALHRVDNEWVFERLVVSGKA